MAEFARVPGLGNMRAEKIKKILDTCASGGFLNNAQTRLVVNTNDDDLGSGVVMVEVRLLPQIGDRVLFLMSFKSGRGVLVLSR